MSDSLFDVSRFENRNGGIWWFISRWLHSVCIRKNFKSREDATVEKAALGAKAAQAISNIRAVSTFLSDDHLREAEAAFRRLDGSF